MKAIPLGLVGLAFFVACAEQQDAPPTTCNVRSANCEAAGNGSTAGSGGSVSGGAGGGTSAGATSMAGAGAGASGGGAPSAGASSAGAMGAGAPGAGAPGAGAPSAGGGGAPGAGAGGAPGAGAAGAPGAGAGGAPATGGVVIETNRSDGTGARFFLKVVPPNNYLQWTGTSATDAEVFQEVVVGTDQVKLLATSVGKYVALDQAVPTGETNQADYLVANQATAATAAVLNIALCAATNTAAAKCAPNCRGIQVMGDDDADNFVVSDDQFTLKTGARARSNSCGGGSTAWESWEIIPH